MVNGSETGGQRRLGIAIITVPQWIMVSKCIGTAGRGSPEVGTLGKGSQSVMQPRNQ